VIEIEFDDQKVRIFLKDLQERLLNLRPALEEIKVYMLSSIEQNFAEGGRPRRWPPLSEKTIVQRRKKGKWPGQILVQSGHLLGSIEGTVRDDSVIIGTNKPYAAIHQFGGKAGRGHKVSIPARPYLVFQDEDIEEIKQILLDYLSQR